MTMSGKLQRLNYYCYTRLKVDELGLGEFDDDVIPNEFHEGYYYTLNVESEKLYMNGLWGRLIRRRYDWVKAKRDYQDMTSAIIDELKGKDNWSCVLGVFTATKIMVRRYKEANPIFASMFCLEMFNALNRTVDVRFLSWDKVYKRTPKPLKTSPVSYKSNRYLDATFIITLLCSSYCLYRLVSD